MTTLKPRMRTVSIYQGDDLDRLQQFADDVNTLEERLEDAIKAAKDAPPLGMLDGDPVGDVRAALQAAKEAHDAYLADAETRAIKAVLHALPRKKYRALVNDHPPRDGNEGDKGLGFNDETFGEVLVPLSLASPTFDTTAERDEFLDELSQGQFRLLYIQAFLLNTSNGADPKALIDSAPIQAESVTQP